MKRKSKNLAIIPARGGSKRIPRKNIRDFLGSPIIKYSIDAAVKSKCFDEVMVSTEDREIAEIASGLGAGVPFFRSAQNSDDSAGLAEAVNEVLEEYKKRNLEFDCFCCIMPTAPFITAERIKKGFSLLKTSGAKLVVPVVRYSYPIQRALKAENGLLKMIWPENYPKRSQDIDPSYHDTGQFYWFKTESFFIHKSFLSEGMIPIEIPEIEVHDIDTEEDWEIAELKYKMIKDLKNEERNLRI